MSCWARRTDHEPEPRPSGQLLIKRRQPSVAPSHTPNTIAVRSWCRQVARRWVRSTRRSLSRLEVSLRTSCIEQIQYPYSKGYAESNPISVLICSCELQSEVLGGRRPALWFLRLRLPCLNVVNRRSTRPSLLVLWEWTQVSPHRSWVYPKLFSDCSHPIWSDGGRSKESYCSDMRPVLVSWFQDLATILH